MSLFKRLVTAVRNPSVPKDFEKSDLDLIQTIFGVEEARKTLLNEASTKPISPEQILRDATALEVMMRTFPWRVLVQAMWRTLMTAMREVLSGPTPEAREFSRGKVRGILMVLHLPYELIEYKKQIEYGKKLEEEALKS